MTPILLQAPLSVARGQATSVPLECRPVKEDAPEEQSAVQDAYNQRRGKQMTREENRRGKERKCGDGSRAGMDDGLLRSILVVVSSHVATKATFTSLLRPTFHLATPGKAIGTIWEASASLRSQANTHRA